MPSTRHTRSRTFMSLATCLLAAAALAGCATEKPKYAKEGLDKAQQTLAMLKSGTEWGMAEQHFMGGDLDKALKSVDRSLALNPGVAKSHLLRGRIMLEKGRLEDSRASLTRAEELDPTIVDTQYFMGVLAERTRQPEAALSRYLKAAELDPNNVQYVIAAAEMQMELGRLDEAEQLLLQRRGSFDNSAAVRQTLGHVAMLRKDYTAAARWLNGAQLLAKDDPRVLEDLAQAQLLARQYADADVNIQRLLDLDQNKGRRDLKQMRARCLVAIDRPVEARSILQELVSDREGGRDLDSWTELGHIAIMLKDRVTLRQAAARVTALSPDKPDGYMLRAVQFRMEGKGEESLAMLDAALQREPGNSSALMLKAMILQDQGRLAEARVLVATALKADPANDRARALLQSLNQPSTVTSHPDAGN